MPFVAPLQSNFNGGEISPSLVGRVKEPRYAESLATCLNYVPLIQGPLDRRPGTYFVKEVKDSTAAVRLRRFKFSLTQNYILEFGNLYIRIYTNHGQLLDGSNNPVEVVSPYVTGDLIALNFTQNADTLYIAGGAYAPRKLVRLSATNWELRTIVFKDGPYLEFNQAQVAPGTQAPILSHVTLTPSAHSGTITVVAGPNPGVTAASADTNGEVKLQVGGGVQHPFTDGQQIVVAGIAGTTEANGTWFVRVIDAVNFALRQSVFANAYGGGGNIQPSVFTAIDVGRHIRMFYTVQWGWGTITAYTNPYTVTVQIDKDRPLQSNADAAALPTWRLGAWCTLLGYPTCVGFHEDRLAFSGTPQFPQRVDMSVSSQYDNFFPTDPDGTVNDNNALSFSLNSHDVNQSQWMTTDEKGLLLGSSSGEWLLRPSVATEAMTAKNVSAKRSTAWGGANAEGTSVAKATIFIQRGARKVRELLFYFDIDGYRANELTELAEHITGTGVTAVAFQQIPYPVLWFVRADGALIGLTYERDMQTLKVGWHRHIIGGVSDAAGNAAIVESIDVIPSPDGTRDEVWMAVKRRVNGATKRYIEYMGKFFEDTDNQEDAHFLDCGTSFDAPVTISGGITKASPGVVTAAAHGFVNGNQVTLRGVSGMTQVNYNRYTVANKTNNTFELTDSSGNNIDTTAYGTYISGGTARKLVTTISGITWLENETVDVLADGAVQKALVVSNSGVLTLPNPAATVHIGYGYNSDVQLLPVEAGSANGTALGKKRRTTRVSIMVHRSLGLKFGMDSSNLDTLSFRTDATPNNQAPALTSGILQETIEADYDFNNQLFLRQDEPLPSRILAVAQDVETQDRT